MKKQRERLLRIQELFNWCHHTDILDDHDIGLYFLNLFWCLTIKDVVIDLEKTFSSNVIKICDRIEELTGSTMGTQTLIEY